MTITLFVKDSFVYAQKASIYHNRGWTGPHQLIQSGMELAIGIDNHSFVMVAGDGDCAWNTAPQPFLVWRITYKSNNSLAHLKAAAVEW